MKTFVVILAAVGLASADVGLGYHYGPAKIQASYGTPSYSISGSNGGFNSGYTGQNTGSIYKGQTLSSGSNGYQTSAGYQNGYPSQVVTQQTGYQGSGYQSGAGYQTGTGHQSGSGYQNAGYQSGNGYQAGSGYQSGTGYQTGNGYQTGAGYQTDNTKYQTGGNYAGVGSSGQQYQAGGSLGNIGVSSGSLQGVQGLNQYQSSSQYQSNSANYQQSYTQIQQQPPQIFKHFYVHAAPEEPEVARPRQPLVLPAPQKHYKIIFIKTPAQAAGSTQYIPVQPQNEEKTIVYVLVKKPESPEEVVLPKFEQKPPSKPEVFFIKYKGKEDSHAVINNIVNEYSSGKESVNVANAFQSSGTLDTISDVKYTPQSVGTSQYAGNSAVAAAQISTGSSGSQYEAGSGSVGQSLSSGLANTGSSGSGFQTQSFGTSTVGYLEPRIGYQVSTSAPIQVSSSTGGYDNGFSSTASSGGAYVQNAVSSNQAIPHETYGPPKFSDN